MTPDDFNFFANLLRQRSGLMLTPDKSYLLASRLVPLGRKWNMTTLEEIIRAVRVHPSEDMLCDITEAMTTNESFFFRDQEQFQFFRKIILPRLIAARQGKQRVRIWSAASSSGQEAYSIAMACADEPRLRGWTIEIIGTDLSNEMVKRAIMGTYTQFEVQRGLPITMLSKYFRQIGSDAWQIDDSVRRMVQFWQANLLDDLKPLGMFDVVFCRNVLIYFDPLTKARVFDSLSRTLAPDGILFLGGAESALGITDKFRVSGDARGVYELTNPAQGSPPSIGAFLKQSPLESSLPKRSVL